jgi:hypothetical protein
MGVLVAGLARQADHQLDVVALLPQEPEQHQRREQASGLERAESQHHVHELSEASWVRVEGATGAGRRSQRGHHRGKRSRADIASHQHV